MLPMRVRPRWCLLCYHWIVIEVRQYIDRLGRNLFERWLESLDGSTRAESRSHWNGLKPGIFRRQKASAESLNSGSILVPGIEFTLAKMERRLSFCLLVVRSIDNRTVLSGRKLFGGNISNASGRVRCL